MSVLRAVLSTVDAAEMYDLIDQVARHTKTTDDTRSLDARRAVALSLLLLGREPHLGPEGDDTPPRAPMLAHDVAGRPISSATIVIDNGLRSGGI